MDRSVFKRQLPRRRARRLQQRHRHLMGAGAEYLIDRGHGAASPFLRFAGPARRKQYSIPARSPQERTAKRVLAGGFLGLTTKCGILQRVGHKKH